MFLMQKIIIFIFCVFKVLQCILTLCLLGKFYARIFSVLFYLFFVVCVFSFFFVCCCLLLLFLVFFFLPFFLGGGGEGCQNQLFQKQFDVFVGPYLGQICLQKLSADDTSR